MISKMLNSKYQVGVDRMIRAEDPPPEGVLDRLEDIRTFYGGFKLTDQMFSGEEFVRFLNDIAFLAAMQQELFRGLKGLERAKEQTTKASAGDENNSEAPSAPNVAGTTSTSLDDANRDPDPGGRELPNPKGERVVGNIGPENPSGPTGPGTPVNSRG